MAKSNLENRIASLVQQHVNQLVSTITRAVRDNIAEELRDYVSGSRNGRIALRPIKKTSRDLSCIAPGCKNKSKGPRFHYLCEKHVGAPRRQYEVWRKTKMKERAQARSQSAA